MPENTDELDALTDAFVTASRALVGIAVRSIEKSPVPITVPQHRVLVLLAAEGGLTVGEVAELSGVNQSNASRLCDRLQRLGLVERQRATEDGRVVRVRLTRRGKQVLAEVTAARRAEMREVLLGVPRTEVRAMLAAVEAFDRAAHERQDREWNVAVE